MLYRPLVLPKLATSRGQHIAPGFSVLATGGPKHKGRSVISNPHLLNGAEGWTILCANTVAEDGRVVATNYGGADCAFLRQDSTGLTNGRQYRVEIHIDSIQQVAAGNIEVFLGNVQIFIRNSPGVHVWTGILSGATGNRLQANLNNATSLTTVVSYFDARELT